VYFVRCRSCGSYLQSPEVTPASLASWYDSTEYQGEPGTPGSAYVDYAQDEASRIIEAKSRFERFLGPILPSRARVLEIGCATGSLLSVLKAAGHFVSGVDLSRRFVTRACEVHGLEVAHGDFLQFEWSAESFDAVMMFGTISNLQNLAASLAKMSALLKEGGSLLFNFPNADSVVARLYGQRYWMFAPSVSNFMTVGGCVQALQHAGLSIRDIRIDRQQPSFSKLLHHTQLDRFLPSRLLRNSHRALPYPIPVPGIKFVRAVKLGAESA
jgi:SAM-dependent methyltransferase